MNISCEVRVSPFFNITQHCCMLHEELAILIPNLCLGRRVVYSNNIKHLLYFSTSKPQNFFFQRHFRDTRYTAQMINEAASVESHPTLRNPRSARRGSDQVQYAALSSVMTSQAITKITSVRYLNVLANRQESLTVTR